MEVFLGVRWLSTAHGKRRKDAGEKALSKAIIAYASASATLGSGHAVSGVGNGQFYGEAAGAVDTGVVTGAAARVARAAAAHGGGGGGGGDAAFSHDHPPGDPHGGAVGYPPHPIGSRIHPSMLTSSQSPYPPMDLTDMHGARFRQECALQDAIRSNACSA
jgi:hypothetical protein